MFKRIPGMYRERFTPVDDEGKVRGSRRRPDDAQYIGQINGRNMQCTHSRSLAALTPVLPSLGKGAQAVRPLEVAVA